MNLGRLLDGVSVAKLVFSAYGKTVQNQELMISGVQYDSRRVRNGDLFVAIRGGTADGHSFIPDAVHKGAIAVVVEDDAVMPDSFFRDAGVAKVVVADTRRALARIAGTFYGNPSEHLRLAGVTGTNGKTTTTHLIKAILESAGGRVGLMGTIGYNTGKKFVEATHTTPEALELNALLAGMIGNGCSAAVMEVSSHALAMQRVHGLTFAAATFTNLTQDHLDFHGTMETYLEAKKMLFDSLGPDAVAVSNGDDVHGERIISDTAAKRAVYSLGQRGDVRGERLSLSVEGTRMHVRHAGGSFEVVSQLIGRFNASNILAACATCLALGVEETAIQRGIASVSAVRGRFEQIRSPMGWTAVIDYAHTPDALQNCLKAIRDILPSGAGRVITIFGCGGNRDRGKRPKMGAIAVSMSDVTIVTSDNPRDEDPSSIIEEILRGTGAGRDVRVEPDRRTAINLGLGLAAEGDVVLIAGKGHETYQVTGTRTEHFDDREEVLGFIGSRDESDGR
jgi:UDP-N-acetylmuramoyl-L-alanyl-D-glutamate--2,6-diaminopimelate ligase